MAKRRGRVKEAKFARLKRHIEISQDPFRSRRARTRAARYAAALAEQLGLLVRPARCEWCHRRQKLQRHHWEYNEPLNVTFLCADCHAVADPMALRMRWA
ncbi:MAG TPA: hypothetical protein VGY53_10495 [Isosphaeraceae bacterium]|nr:hypothetical protein [Isosphaeraceae bacterium]